MGLFYCWNTVLLDYFTACIPEECRVCQHSETRCQAVNTDINYIFEKKGGDK